jgi:hypothetical protein
VWDIDGALSNDLVIRNEAIAGIQSLLSSANYDLAAWRDWLGHLVRRPMEIEI